MTHGARDAALRLRHRCRVGSQDVTTAAPGVDERADAGLPEDPMVTVDRLRKLRADLASGRVTGSEFVEQRHHLLDRRHLDLPHIGPERRQGRPGGLARCEWCSAPTADVIPAQLVAGGRLLVDGVRLCTCCARLVSLEEHVYAVTSQPSVAVTFLTEVYRRRARARSEDAAAQRLQGRRSTDRRDEDQRREVAIDLRETAVEEGSAGPLAHSSRS